MDPATDEIWMSRSVKVIEGEHTNQEGCQEEKEVQAQPPTRTLEYGSCEDPTQDKKSSGDENVDEESQTPPVTPVEIQARVSKRNNKGVPPLRLGYKVRVFSVREPRSWDNMLQMTPRERMPWLAAAEEEIRSLHEHQVWEMSDLPPDRKAVSCKWVFKGKTDGDGQVHTYKARLVARGFSQRYGEDYDETLAPVVKHETVRVLLALATQQELHVRHLDVKNAYLNGKLDEVIFMEQHVGFVEAGQENKVLRLRMSLYGLKQSARVWNKTAASMLEKMGFTCGDADKCLYSRHEGEKMTYILLFVDDLLVAGRSAETTAQVSKQIKEHFQIKDLDDVSHYLGIQIEREEDGSYLLNQRAKIIKLVKENGMTDSKPVATPMESGFLAAPQNDTVELESNGMYRKLMGSLLYLATVSRPDIAVAVGLLCRRVEKPTQYDWKAAKRVVRYLASSSDVRLRLSPCKDQRLTYYVDADWAGDRTDRKSTSGYVFLYGGAVVSWCSKKQTSVAM